MLRHMGTTAAAGALLCTTALSYAYLGRPNGQPPAEEPPDLIGPATASFTSVGGSFATDAETTHPGATNLDMDLLVLPIAEVANAGGDAGPGTVDDGLKERVSSAGTALLVGMGLLALAVVRRRQSPPSVH